MPAWLSINLPTDDVTPLPTRFVPFMFCSQVETWLQRHVTKGKVLWHGAKVEVGPKCVHMCMFTQGRWKNLALSRPSWLEGFAELVTFLGGNGAGAAKQLRAALSKDGTYDPAYAQRLEEWHVARLKKYGLYGSGECCPISRLCFRRLCLETFVTLRISRNLRVLFFYAGEHV